MELMAGTDEEHEFRGDADGVEPNMKSAKQGSSSRHVSGRYLIKGRAQSRAYGNDKGRGSHLRRNLSIGDGSELFSGRDDAMIRIGFSSRTANNI